MIDISGFEIVKPLKPGGQKKVYLTKNSDYGYCILKIGKCKSVSSLGRIKREVKILRSVDTPYFPKNYRFESSKDGDFLIVEEYIDGNTLADSDDFKRDERNIVKLILHLIDGLSILWDRDIIHRDLKPDNIIIKSDMTPVIIDLGIARDLNDESLTATYFQRGPCTPIYASPEQLRNEKYSIDERSDFFTLGIIMAEQLSGYNPFDPKVVKGDSIANNILEGNYYFDESIFTKELAKIIKKLLACEPFLRYRNYTILKEELQKFLEGRY